MLREGSVDSGEGEGGIGSGAGDEGGAERRDVVGRRRRSSGIARGSSIELSVRRCVEVFFMYLSFFLFF